MWTAIIVEIESDNARIDKSVRWKPIRRILILGVDIMVWMHEGRLCVRAYTEKQIGKYKTIKEIKLSEKFALAAMQVAEKNELLQIYCEELQPFFKK